MLGLKLYSMDSSMVIDTLANGSVTTNFVSGCPLTIFGKIFVMDLVCLPLHQIDVILGMNWLEFNYVHINCYSKTARFPDFEDGGELMFLSAKQVGELVKDKASLFAMFSTLQVDRKAITIEFPVVCEFPNVFLEDISPVSMAPYRMSASELSELNIQLEELLEKKFVRPSVSPWGAPVLLVKKKDGSMM
ncbi:uncharacterized protein LOC131641829 [Vicia villosa]|uniref:uncharacterized protein LOC131641829 n=1 Tax=Vicia villosa TaxID=3911 RepID=UPI00273C316C|nr:uncharacterized protein LOC131641829 [Vicia villosa]